MQMNEMSDVANRIEESVDQAVQAMQRAGGAPPELRDSVSQMHQQARQLRDQARQSTDQQQLAAAVDALEQLGDRAKQACMTAGGVVDPQLQSAVMRAHDEISNLKKQLH